MKLRVSVHVVKSFDGSEMVYRSKEECAGLDVERDGDLILYDDEGTISAEYEPGSWSGLTIEVVE